MSLIEIFKETNYQFQIELIVLNSNTWNHLSVGKQYLKSPVGKLINIVTYTTICFRIIYIYIYIYIYINKDWYAMEHNQSN